MNWSFPIMDQFLNPRVFTQIVLQWGNPSILMCFEESQNPKWRNIQIFYSNTTEGCKTCRLSPQVKTIKLISLVYCLVRVRSRYSISVWNLSSYGCVVLFSYFRSPPPRQRLRCTSRTTWTRGFAPWPRTVTRLTGFPRVVSAAMANARKTTPESNKTDMYRRLFAVNFEISINYHET